jgi:hypothetical protein
MADLDRARHRAYSHFAIETVGGDVWVNLNLQGDATEIAIGDQVLPLPDLQFDPSLHLSLLARFDASGRWRRSGSSARGCRSWI